MASVTTRFRMRSPGTVVVATVLALLTGAIAVPQSQASAPVAVAASNCAGYLDRSFAGGKGYRVLTPPTWAKSTGSIQWSPGSSALLVTPTGRLRTFEGYEDSRTGSEAVLHHVVRGWTSNGSIDTSFSSGKIRDTRLVAGPEGGDFIDDVAAVGEGVAWTSSFYSGGYRGHTGELLGGNGRLIDTWRYGYCGDDNGCLDLGAPAPTTGRNLDGAATTWSCVSTSSSDAALTGAAQLAVIPRNGAPAYRPVISAPNCHSLARASDGRLFVVAQGAGGTMVLRSLTTAGTLNPAWGVGGSAKPVVIGGAWSSVGVRTAGSRVYVAMQRVTANGMYGGVAVAAFTNDGRIDTSFGGDGLMLTGPGGDAATATPRNLGAWTADAHGVVLALNGTPEVQKAGGANRFILMRLRASDGRPDATFGVNGWLATSGPGIDVIARGDRYLTLSGGPIYRTLRTFTYVPLVMARRLA